MLSLKSTIVASIAVFAAGISCGRVPSSDEAGSTYQSAAQAVAPGPAKLVKKFPLSGPPDWPLQPLEFAQLGETVIFTAYGRENRELWKSDGTSEGTVIIRDIWVGSGSSNATSFTELNGSLYFAANDGVSGMELWKTDGTSAGTVLVRDVCLTQCDSNPSRLTNVNGTLFFRANDGVNGEELWKSDGTAAGTVLVKDINPGPAGSDCESLTSANGLLFFSAIDPVAGEELWKSDGTASGTVMVKDISPGTNGSMSRSRTSTASEASLDPGVPLHHAQGVGNVVFFVADDDVHGAELWKSDGTEAGTVLVKDINPTGQPAFVTALTDINGTLFFSADDGVHGSEFWTSDGTEAGTVLVFDLWPGSNGSSPASFTILDGQVIFQATAPAIAAQLWRTDGTSRGTTHIADLTTGYAGSILSNFSVVNHSLYFTREVGPLHGEVWVTDGTAGGTRFIQDAPRIRVDLHDPPVPPTLLGLSGRVFFGAQRQLWVFDPSLGQSTKLKTYPTAVIFPVIHTGLSVAVNDTLFLVVAGDPQNQPLWKSDGTEAGTVPLEKTGLDGLDCLMQVNGTLVFSGAHNSLLHELWRSDGTDAGTFKINPPGVSRTNLSVWERCNSPILQNNLYFTSETGSTDYSLWKTDGTIAGTVRVKEVSNETNREPPGDVVRAGDMLFFSQRFADRWVLWASDGSSSGTAVIKEFALSPASVSSLEFIGAVQGVAYLYFTVEGDRRELWKSDGTVGGTVLVDGDVSPLWPRAANDLLVRHLAKHPDAIVELNGSAYFLADGGSRRMQLRRVDATGTAVIKEFAPPILGGIPLYSGLLSINGALFFTAYDPVFGAELWTSDGTPDGTMLLKDIEPGPMSSVPYGQMRVGDAIVFQAADSHGLELWRSGRTASSTVLVHDIRAGGPPSMPMAFVRAGSNVFFSAFDEDSLLGVFAIPATEIDTPPQLNCPDEVTVDATDDEGASVPFTVTASDAETEVTPVLSQEPGSSFTIGTHTVTATVVDGLGTTVSCAFPVTVRVGVTCPADITVEATSSAGAAVSFEAVPGRPTTTITYSSEPGSEFALGKTTVTATATNAAGKSSTCSFNVNVVDTTPPVFAPLQDLLVESPTPDGVNVEFPQFAVNEAVALASVVATPASGSLFPLGVTPVTVVATDAAGNFSEGSFTVTVVLARHKVGTGCGCSSGETWSGALLLLGLVARMRRRRDR